MSVVGDNSLRAPVTPKLVDTDAERVRSELEAKIVELQTIVRALVDVVRVLGGAI